MTTAWSHLPNAHHIDRILADLTVNPGDWHWAWHRVRNRADYAARDAVHSAARDAVYSAARDAASYAVHSAARDAALYAAINAVYSAAWAATESAILALIAWPESADYLELSVDSLRVLAALGDHKAVLILPAAIAFASQKAAVVQMIDN